MNDMFTEQELQEEQDIADQLESEQAFQQSTDEQQELLTKEDIRSFDFWKMENEINNLIRKYGRASIIDHVVDVIDQQYRPQA